MGTKWLEQQPPPTDFCEVPVAPDLCAIQTIGEIPGDVVGAAAGSAFESMVQALTEGVGKAVAFMMSFWMDIPIPSLDADGGAVDRLRDATSWLTALVAVVSLFIVVIRMALARRGGEGDELHEASKGILRLVLATSVAVPAVMLLSKGGDAWARWLVNKAADGDVGKAVGKLVAFSAINGSLGFVFILALIALVASIVQAFFILIRDALLILLIGALPLAAASSITPGGQHTWKKMLGWLGAFLLFKPVAAMCYAGALWAISKPDNATSAIAGIFLIILSVLTLPALMRLISPAVERIGGGGGGGLAAVGGAATGAVSLAAMRGGGASRVVGSQPAAFKGAQGAAGSAGAGGARGMSSGPARQSAGSGRSGGAGAAGAAKAHPAAAAAGVATRAARSGHQAVNSAVDGAADGKSER